MFEINDELKQVQNGLINSQSMSNTHTQSNIMRPYSVKSNRTNYTEKSLKDALFHKKYQTETDYSAFPLIERDKKDYGQTLKEFENNLNIFDKERKKKVEQNVKKLKQRVTESIKENKRLGKERGNTFTSINNDVFESSIKKVRIDILKRKAMSHYNSHTRVNNSVLTNKHHTIIHDVDFAEELNEDQDKKNKKVLRPTTVKILKVNDNIRDIEKLDKFQLETEVP